MQEQTSIKMLFNYGGFNETLWATWWAKVWIYFVCGGNLKRIPVIEPRSIDPCFLLESINEMKKQIGDLCDIKTIVTELQDSMKNLKKRQCIAS